MSKVQSDRLYQYIEELKIKLFTVKGEIDDEIYTLIEERIKVTEEKIRNLSESPSLDELRDITKIIGDLEVRYLSDKAVKEMAENAQRKSFATQLATVEQSVEDNIENVEEYMTEAKEYWEKIKDAYDRAEQAEILERMTGIALRCILEKLKYDNKLNISILPVIDDSNGCKAVIKFMLDKKDKLDNIGRSSVELWIGKVIDKSTGKLDINEVKELVSSEKFWRILCGNKEISLVQDNVKKSEVVQEAKSDKPISNSKDKESEYDKKLKALAEEYGVSWKKLITRDDQMAFILRNDRGRSRVKKIYNNIYRRTEELENECVAIVFNNNITQIDAGSFANMRRLEQVVFPDMLRYIGECAFRQSGLREVILPEWVGTIAFSAFGNCKNLQQVVFNHRLSLIEGDAFYGTGVTKIITPDSLRKIGNCAFRECTDLKVVQLNEGLETIGLDIFSNSRVTELEIPETIKFVIEEGTEYRADFVSSLNDRIETLNSLTSLKTIKIIDSEGNVVKSYSVEPVDDGSNRKRRLVFDMPKGVKNNRRTVGIER